MSDSLRSTAWGGAGSVKVRDGKAWGRRKKRLHKGGDDEVDVTPNSRPHHEV
jgi:hypothetical protein|tara:strand:+ start:138 stop:293 length:156 start_codon:yes stop_codon:yes gene_type:complete